MSELSACRKEFEDAFKQYDTRIRFGEYMDPEVHSWWKLWERVWNAALDQAALACEAQKLPLYPDGDFLSQLHDSACDNNASAIRALKEPK